MDDTTWAVREVRVVLGPAPAIGDLLAALVELMTTTGIEAHEVTFDEVPAGRRLLARCRLRSDDVGPCLAGLVTEPVPAVR
ncbi:MAG: hypothetical protein U0W40_12635 [Acidimicrobiia bacterium]